MDKQIINQIIGQIEKSIDQIEPSLDKEEFKDYCDNAYTLISYWKQQIKLNKDDNSD
jgi:hypothetical protein